jgi:hypothetical protein
MDLRRISESGSYARFFFGLITMYFVVSVFAFCLIAVAYAEERPSFSDVRGENTCGLDAQQDKGMASIARTVSRYSGTSPVKGRGIPGAGAAAAIKSGIQHDPRLGRETASDLSS